MGEADDEEAEEGMEPSFGGLGAGGSGGGSRRALQVELPAQLGMEPEDLQRIRWGRAEQSGRGRGPRALAARGRGGASSRATCPPRPALGCTCQKRLHPVASSRRDGLYAGSRQPPAKQRRVLVIAQQAEAAGGSTAAGTPAPSAAAPAPAAAAAATAHAPLAARNAWRKHQAAPVRPAARPAAPRTPPPVGLPLLPAGPMPVSSLAGRQCLVPAPKPTSEEQPPARERCLPDAGMFSGAAFRTGWAPNAVLAHAGGRASSAAHVTVRQLAVGARAAAAGEPAGADSPFQQRQRDALAAALSLHMQHSSPDPCVEEPQEGGEGAAAAGVPQWRLRCRRQEELRKLTLAYMELCTAAAAKVGAGCAALMGRTLPGALCGCCAAHACRLLCKSAP